MTDKHSGTCLKSLYKARMNRSPIDPHHKYLKRISSFAISRQHESDMYTCIYGKCIGTVPIIFVMCEQWQVLGSSLLRPCEAHRCVLPTTHTKAHTQLTQRATPFDKLEQQRHNGYGTVHCLVSDLGTRRVSLTACATRLVWELLEAFQV